MLKSLYAFLTMVEQTGTEAIEELCPVGAGFFSGILWSLIEIVLCIIWGLFVYGSPIIIPVVIYTLIKGKRISKGTGELANGLMKEVLAACEQEGIHNVREFSEFFQDNNCTIELNIAELTLRARQKKICTVSYSTLGYEMTTDSTDLQKDLKKKLKKLGKSIAQKLSVSCRVDIHADIDSGLKGIGPSHIESKLSYDGKTVVSREVHDQYYGWHRESNITCQITPRYQTVKKKPIQDNGLKKL